MAETYQEAADGTVWDKVRYAYYLNGDEPGLLWTVTAFRGEGETTFTVTEYDYTAEGWVETITVTDDASRVTAVVVEDDSSVQVSKLTWDYDNAGQPDWEKQRLGTDATGDERKIAYAYDDNSNVTGITYPGQAGDGSNGKTLTLTYDAMNRVSEIKEGTDVVGAYDYNALGQPTRLDLLNDTFVLYAYDATGRLAALSNRYPEDAVLSSFNYTRSGEGDPTRITATRALAEGVTSLGRSSASSHNLARRRRGSAAAGVRSCDGDDVS